MIESQDRRQDNIFSVDTVMEFAVEAILESAHIILLNSDLNPSFLKTGSVAQRGLWGTMMGDG